VTGAAGLFAFRRPGLAGMLFVLLGGQTMLSIARSALTDPTFPTGNLTGGTVGVVLPAVVLGMLLISVWWAEKRRAHPGASVEGSSGDVLPRAPEPISPPLSSKRTRGAQLHSSVRRGGSNHKTGVSRTWMASPLRIRWA
jgi:hypothetical protein